MPSRISFSLRHTAITVLLFTCVFISNALGDYTVPIVVEFRLPNAITGHWAQGRKDEVKNKLTNRLLTRLNEEHPHWNFSSALDANSPAIVQATVAQGGSNEILLKYELRLRHPGHKDDVFLLGEKVLYKPGHFSVFGRPTPTEAENDVWGTLKSILEKRHKANLEILSAQVPLARNPSPIKVPDRTVVLPLSKDRYLHLAWSTFRLICPEQQPVELLSEASNKWGSYDPDLPFALQVTVIEDLSEQHLQQMTPRLIYLKEYKKKTTWIIF